MLKEGAIGEVELHDLVLYTMGADPVAGSHFFCMLKEDGMKADPPVPVVNSLFEMKDDETMDAVPPKMATAPPCSTCARRRGSCRQDSSLQSKMELTYENQIL